MKMKKSSRHSKITGDFAEALVLYWLSKYGYECARVDHTGIDLIARTRDSDEVMGISVKCRSRHDEVAGRAISLPHEDIVKARAACQSFKCVPYLAFVVDGASAIRSFLLPIDHFESIAGGRQDGLRYWKMGVMNIADYRGDACIRGFELNTASCSWRDAQHS